MKKLLGVAVVIVLLAVGSSAWAENVYYGLDAHTYPYLEKANGDVEFQGVGMDCFVGSGFVIKGDRAYMPKTMFRYRFKPDGKYFVYLDTMKLCGAPVYRVNPGLKEARVFSRNVVSKREIRREMLLPFDGSPKFCLGGKVEPTSEGQMLVLQEGEGRVEGDKADYDSRERMIPLSDLFQVNKGVKPPPSMDPAEEFVGKIYTPAHGVTEIPVYSYDKASFGLDGRKEKPIPVTPELVLRGMSLYNGHTLALSDRHRFPTDPADVEKRIRVIDRGYLTCLNP